MKYVPRMPIPWDMVVFLTITTAGFGYSVNRLVDDSKSMGLEREIASFRSNNEDLSKMTADLGCLERSLPTQKHSSDAGTIRLRGKFCHLSARAMRAFDGVQIKNLTNGFEGTVFLQGNDASFVTDYVVLSHGRNQIEIAWRESRGAPERRVTAEVYDR
jgi:hypothetical protein